MDRMRAGRGGSPAGVALRMAEKVPAAAEAIARRGVHVIYPEGVSAPRHEKFECAGRVADNYFVFPNGRVYRCPLCEDLSRPQSAFEETSLVDAPRLNESDFFRLNIAEGCVMNDLIQPDNLYLRRRRRVPNTRSPAAC